MRTRSFEALLERTVESRRMQLFDTARQEVVPFEPRHGRVGIYVCGITPYDSAHLGHAFVYHVFDVINRRFRDAGLTVQSVRNVTDVDDDILRVARLRGVDFRKLAADQVRVFDNTMADIGLLPVDAAPRATEHVGEMVDWITRLVDGGYAYAVNGWVFFDSGAYPDYGRLSRLDQPTMIELSRDRGADPDDPRKRHPLDFVLWQASAPGEPRWPSPWSDGRPGWHIECSVMSTGALGHPIDIHGGGDDLIYPHHESEIAQAEAAGVAPYVRHWSHVAMVKLAGVKMSKSLGNLVFVSDLVARVPGGAVRILLSSHHYRQSWNYDDAEVAGAGERMRGMWPPCTPAARSASRRCSSMSGGSLSVWTTTSTHPERFSSSTRSRIRCWSVVAGPASGTTGQQLLGRLLSVLGAAPEAVPA